MASTERGPLLIADISGYTKFVGGVELEHGAAIVADLLGVAVEQLAAVATLAKLEGDAAFCAGTSLPSEDGLMAALFGCYDAFRRRLRDAAHLTTCSCAACSAMSSLDLKIVVHSGEYLIHRVAGSSELTGSDVILVHRLLKNSVSERGYALFTDAIVRDAALPVTEWGCRPQQEEVDDVGPVEVHVLDLDAVWQAEQERAAVLVSESDGKVMTFELPAPPPVVWEWFSDPHKRIQWNIADRIDIESSKGPSGVGTVNHCVHGKQTITEEIVDWKPFDWLRHGINRLGLDGSHLRMSADRRTSRRRGGWTDADLEHAVAGNITVSGVLRELGYAPSGGSHRFITAHIRRLGLDTSHFLGQRWARGTHRPHPKAVPLESLLVDGTHVGGSKLRRRLVAAGLKTDRCEDCGLTSWQGQPLRLEVHHVNGVHTDNRLENLRILCPNCHAVAEAVLRILRRRIPIGREAALRSPTVRVRVSPPALLADW